MKTRKNSVFGRFSRCDGLKYGMRNLVNFNPTAQKSENISSMSFFCPKYTAFKLQKGGIIFHDTEQRCKFLI